MSTQRSITLPENAELHFTGNMSNHVNRMKLAAEQFPLFADYLRRAARREIFNERQEHFQAYVITSPHRSVCFRADDDVIWWLIGAIMMMLEPEFEVSSDELSKTYTVQLYR